MTKAHCNFAKLYIIWRKIKIIYLLEPPLFLTKSSNRLQQLNLKDNSCLVQYFSIKIAYHCHILNVQKLYLAATIQAVQKNHGTQQWVLHLWL